MEGVRGGTDGKKGRKRGRKARAGIPSFCHKDLVHTLLLEQLNNFRAQHGGRDSDGSGHLQTADGMIPPPEDQVTKLLTSQMVSFIFW